MPDSRLAILAVALVAVSPVAAGDEGIKSCIEMLKPEHIMMMCCDINHEVWNETTAETECLKKFDTECEQLTCKMKALKLLKDDKIDEVAIGKKFDEYEIKQPGSKGMIQRVREYCFNGQYQEYVFSSVPCDIMNFRICTYINAMMACPTWKTSDGCTKLRKATDECREEMEME